MTEYFEGGGAAQLVFVHPFCVCWLLFPPEHLGLEQAFGRFMLVERSSEASHEGQGSFSLQLHQLRLIRNFDLSIKDIE